MKFWQSLAFTEPEQLPEVAKIVEEVGFTGAMVSDHVFFPGDLKSKYPYSEDGSPGFAGDTPFPDPWVAIAAMGAVTTRLRFTTLVYILPLHRPLEVAKACASLAVMTGNRFALGAGAGWIKEEFDTFGVDFHKRGKIFDEAIDVLHKLWAGGMVEHHGDNIDFASLQMAPVPSEPVPIWIGGVSEPALRRAAQRGDGWLGSGQSPEEGLAILARLKELRSEAGRQHEPFEAMVPLTTAPEADTLKRLEDAGATSTVSYPFTYTLGPTSTLEAKRAYLEGFAEQVIKPLGS